DNFAIRMQEPSVFMTGGFLHTAIFKAWFQVTIAIDSCERNMMRSHRAVLQSYPAPKGLLSSVAGVWCADDHLHHRLSKMKCRLVTPSSPTLCVSGCSEILHSSHDRSGVRIVSRVEEIHELVRSLVDLPRPAQRQTSSSDRRFCQDWPAERWWAGF